MPDFVWTSEQRVDMERHRAVRQAQEWLRRGGREQAVKILLDSVHKQLRWSDPVDEVLS